MQAAQQDTEAQLPVAVEPQETADKLGRCYWRPESLAKLEDPKELHRFLNATDHLTDDDYEAHVHDIGARVALWHMRRAAWAGNLRTVQACETYLRRVDAHRRQLNDRRSITRVVQGAAAFVQPARGEPAGGGVAL